MITAKEKWFINETELDDEQYDIKRLSHKNSYLVKGCAGSGKTVLAIWRALEILARGEDCVVVVYTKALRKFIRDALSQNPSGKEHMDIVMTYDSWKFRGMPSKAHIIVDEVQDFTSAEIESFKKCATVSLALFGDSAQKLYQTKTIRAEETGISMMVKTLSIEEISDLLTLSIRPLKNNHRLPRKIASFAKHLIVSNEPLDGQCVKEGEKLPLILKCSSELDELSLIMGIIQSKGLRDVGILLPDNDAVEKVFNFFLDNNISCERKYKDKKDSSNDIMTLNFLTDNPKIMTYHSAKGLQFDHVFIPFCSKFNSKIWEKSPLYVACTRTSTDLTITCTNAIHSYIEPIASDLYDLIDYTKKISI